MSHASEEAAPSSPATQEAITMSPAREEPAPKLPATDAIVPPPDANVNRKGGDDRDLTIDSGSEPEGNIEEIETPGKPKNKKKKHKKKKSVQTVDAGSRITLNEYTELRRGGLNDGVYSRTLISVGSRIVNEPPLLSMYPKERITLRGIYETYLKLSPREQLAIWDYEPRPTVVPAEVTLFIEGLVHYHQGLQKNATENTLTARDQEMLAELGLILGEMCFAWRIAARLLGHRYSLVTASASELDRIPSHIPLVGFFCGAANFNHSCVPNCCATYNVETGRMTVHAMSEIQPDEQLTLSHIGNKIWYHTADERKKMVLKATGRICQCAACDPRDEKFERSEDIRRRLHLGTAYMGQFLAKICTEDDCSYLAFMELTKTMSREHLAGPLGPAEVVEARILLTRMKGDLYDIGCRGLELPRWENVLVMIIYPWALEHRVGSINEESYSGWEARAYTLARTAGFCFGTDHPDYEPLRLSLEAAKNISNERQEEEGAKRREMIEKAKKKQQSDVLVGAGKGRRGGRRK